MAHETALTEVASDVVEQISRESASDALTASWLRHYDGSIDAVESMELPGRNISFHPGAEVAAQVLAPDWHDAHQSGDPLPLLYEESRRGMEYKRHPLGGSEGVIQCYHVSEGSLILAVELDDGTPVSVPIAKNSAFTGSFQIH